jgi:PAS domain S-box-containing protein
MESGQQLDEHARFEAFFPGSAADFLRLLGAWSIPFALLDDRDTILFWNRGAARFYGRAEDDALGRRWQETVGENVAPPAPAAGVRTQRYEATHRRVSGEDLAVIVTRTELPAADGTTAAFVLITDLTASKALERKLARRVAQLSVIREIGECLQSAMSLEEILRTILVGATASQGLRFNRAFLLLVDERRGELRGRDAIGPSDASEAQRIWSRLAASSQTLRELVDQFEPHLPGPPPRVIAIARQIVAKLDDKGRFIVQALNRNGTTRVVAGRAAGSDEPIPDRIVEILGVDSFVAVPLTAEGRPVGLLLADNAITRRPISDEDVEILELLGLQAAHALERARLTDELARQVASLAAATRELRINQERLLLTERLSAIGEMAAHVAHEIRNPLVAIGGFARSLLQKDPAHDRATRDALEIIVDEVRRLESIVRDVLDFSRPTGPKIGRVDARRLSEEACDLLHGEMERAGIAVSLDEAPDTPPAAADRDQLFQAVVNVLRNSVHAMPRGGRIAVRVRPFQRGVELSIADTGIGMSQDVLAHALEPFYTTKNDGSGLGLTIASRIVRDHNGEIRIESKEGEGTTIALRLPASEVHDGQDSRDRR